MDGDSFCWNANRCAPLMGSCETSMILWLLLWASVQSHQFHTCFARLRSNLRRAHASVIPVSALLTGSSSTLPTRKPLSVEALGVEVMTSHWAVGRLFTIGGFALSTHGRGLAEKDFLVSLAALASSSAVMRKPCKHGHSPGKTQLHPIAPHILMIKSDESGPPLRRVILWRPGRPLHPVQTPCAGLSLVEGHFTCPAACAHDFTTFCITECADDQQYGHKRFFWCVFACQGLKRYRRAKGEGRGREASKAATSGAVCFAFGRHPGWKMKTAHCRV